MLFYEDWISRVVNKEGQIIKDLRMLSFKHDELYYHVFRSALEQMHRSRPVIVKVNVVGPRWIKTPDCETVVRVTSNFMLTNQAQAAAIYTGREVRQNFEENDYAVWIPMGLSMLRYTRKFEYNFTNRLEKYPLCQFDIYPGIEYSFLLPFDYQGELTVCSAGREASEFVVTADPVDKRRIKVVYTPHDGSKEPLTNVKPKLPLEEIKNPADFLNGSIGRLYDPEIGSEPTLNLTGFTKYPFFNSDQWNNQSELIEMLITERFLRAIAQAKTNFVVSEVEFSLDRDHLIARATEIGNKAEELITKNNLWWEF